MVQCEVWEKTKINNRYLGRDLSLVTILFKYTESGLNYDKRKLNVYYSRWKISKVEVELIGPLIKVLISLLLIGCYINHDIYSKKS